jgi:ATP-binding cassette subfamily C protein
MAKAHAVVAEHIGEFRAATTDARAAGLSLVRAWAVASTVRAGTTAGVLALTLYIARSGLGISIAQLLVLALIFNRILPQMGRLQGSLLRLVQAGPAYVDLVGVITDCEAAGEPSQLGSRQAPPLLESVRLCGVGFAYTPGVQVLDGVTLTIPARRTTALVGPSGAGKTTLADTVIGLIRPDHGDVLVDGVPLLDEEIEAWRSRVALVPQDPFLFTDTIAANLRWAAPDASEDRLWAALSEAAAARFVSALPDRLNTVVGDRGARLSGGERQRIVLARALLRRPQLIVLDEPTSAMDTETEQLVRATVARLHGRHTVLLIAHRLSTVRDADQIVVLDAGRVVESGTWEQLAGRNGGRLNDLIQAGVFA